MYVLVRLRFRKAVMFNFSSYLVKWKISRFFSERRSSLCCKLCSPCHMFSSTVWFYLTRLCKLGPHLCFFMFLTASPAIIKILSIIFLLIICGVKLMKRSCFRVPSLIVELYKLFGSVVSQQQFYMILS